MNSVTPTYLKVSATAIIDTDHHGPSFSNIPQGLEKEKRNLQENAQTLTVL